MTTPRYVLPGSFHFITRRTTQRQFLLRPSAATNRIFEFCLALAAKKVDIRLIAWLVMSNHYHAVVYDEKGNVPAFVEHLHKLVARAMNVHWRRSENFWSSEETNIVLLGSEEDVLEKVAYTLANPVSAGLVDKAAQWPGASSLALLSGKTKRVARPEQFFKRNGTVVPEEVELACVQPRGSAKKESFAAWATRVKEKVADIERRRAKERAATPRLRTLGVKGVLATSPTARPKTKARGKKIRPHIACRNAKDRMVLLERRKTFLLHHQDAWEELVADEAKIVVFPKGTYLHRRLATVRIGKRDPFDPDVIRRHITRIPVDHVS